VNDIVEAAGVAKGSFFNHFIDKDAFGAEIARMIRRDLEDRVDHANSDVTDPKERFVRGICLFVHFAQTEPKRARIMLRGMDRAMIKKSPLNKGLRRDIKAMIRAGDMPDGKSDCAFIMALGTCFALMMAVLNEKMNRAQFKSLCIDSLVACLIGLGIQTAIARQIVEKSVAQMMTG